MRGVYVDAYRQHKVSLAGGGKQIDKSADTTVTVNTHTHTTPHANYIIVGA